MIVPGIEAPIRLALHPTNDRYISDGIDETGSWEPFETELVRRAIRPGDLVIDKPGFKLFAPFTTMIVLSVVVSLVIWLLRR